MKRVLILSFILAGLWSCQTKIDEESPTSYSSGESAVEVSVLSSLATRSVEYSNPDENIIDNLELLSK